MFHYNAVVSCPTEAGFLSALDCVGFGLGTPDAMQAS